MENRNVFIYACIYDSRKHGAGFAVRKSLLNLRELSSDGSERIISLQLHTSDALVNLLNAYSKRFIIHKTPRISSAVSHLRKYK